MQLKINNVYRKFVVTLAALCFLLTTIYYLYFWFLPSVTIVNNTSDVITSNIILLPESKMDFGEIEQAEQNTIHYQLTQKAGRYLYQFIISGEPVTGRCGNVRDGEINKRVVIVISGNTDIKCVERN